MFADSTATETHMYLVAHNWNLCYFDSSFYHTVPVSDFQH